MKDSEAFLDLFFRKETQLSFFHSDIFSLRLDSIPITHQLLYIFK